MYAESAREAPGGETSIPTSSTIAEINNEIKKRIENGTYNIGELITPKQFSRLTLNNDGTFLTESFSIEGRKIPLLDFCQRMLDTQENLGVLCAKDVDFEALPMETINTQLIKFGEVDNSLNDSDKKERLKEIQTTRHVTCWADHSAIAGHTLCTQLAACMIQQFFSHKKRLKKEELRLMLKKS